MEDSYHSYPKVYALGHPWIKELFDGEVEITEKIDGSQFSFGIFDGEVRMRSKGQKMVINAPEKMFLPAVETVLRLVARLKDGFTYRCEFLSKPKHNTLAYSSIPDQHLILFDVNDGYESYIRYQELMHIGASLGLEVVPRLFQGYINKAEDIQHLLETDSILGGTKVEGIVIKNYSKYGTDKKVLMGKYVSEKFKEVHNKEWKKANPGGGDVIFMIGQRYRNENRWKKAIQHLKEKGELCNEPKDIGNLMKEIRKDIKEECTEEIKNSLYKWAYPKIERMSTAGFPEWYKEKLAKTQFETLENESGG